MPHGFDRRTFLRGGCSLVLTGCALKASDTGSAARTDSGGTTTDPTTSTTTTTTTTPPPPAYPCGQSLALGGAGWYALALADWPDLADVGGWYAVDVGGMGLVIAHVEAGCYSAIVRACSHQGTSIEYRPDRGEYVCPNHGAIYAADGEAVSGPQPSGLPVFPCGRDGESIWVQVG